MSAGQQMEVAWTETGGLRVEKQKDTKVYTSLELTPHL